MLQWQISNETAVVDLASQTKVDSTTVVNSHKDITNNQLEHSRPTVDCYIKSIKATALLDACSTGPTSYVVNYILEGSSCSKR